MGNGFENMLKISTAGLKNLFGAGGREYKYKHGGITF
jgi:hypothetical protein